MRPTSSGLEGHLATIHKMIAKVRPRVVVIDPITNLISASGTYDVKSMLMRLVDFLKVEQITSMFTNLTFEETLMRELQRASPLSWTRGLCCGTANPMDDQDVSFTF